MDILRTISECEERYNNRLKEIANQVLKQKKVFVMVTGASCAGKTTTTKKLREYFSEHGVKAETISLDDFYLSNELIPEDKDGEKDYETIDSLDIPLLDKVLQGLAHGNTVRVPRFDFAKKKRSDDYEEMALDKGEVVIIEGLHALNPLVVKHIDDRLVYRVYLYAENESYDVKLLRRIVRDEYYRFFGAEITLDMWDKVLLGEEKYIKPYMSIADAKINTFFEYETPLLATEGIKLLSKVQKDSPNYKTASELMEKISGLQPIDYSLVPKNSLMFEFIKTE